MQNGLGKKRSAQSGSIDIPDFVTTAPAERNGIGLGLITNIPEHTGHDSASNDHEVAGLLGFQLVERNGMGLDLATNIPEHNWHDSGID